MKSDTSSEALPAFPKTVWIICFFAIWSICAIIPTLLVLVGNHFFSIVDKNIMATAGTIGDAFGLANSFFSGAALLFVIWSIRLQQKEIQFARNEWQENTESQKEQARLMKEAATLTSINQIYSHYAENYGTEDDTNILLAIARGHQRWAIRESFGYIDALFDTERLEQVKREAAQLAELLMVPSSSDSYIREVATKTASLLVEERANKIFRKSLWPLYEILRYNPSELCNKESTLYAAFIERANETVKAWKSIKDLQQAVTNNDK